MSTFLSVPVNYWTVLAAAVASILVGAIWYSPVVFGKRFMHLTGMGEGDKKGMTRGYVITFLAMLVLSWVLTHFVAYLNVVTWQGGVQLGFWLWLGFVATTSLADYVWGKKPTELYFIKNGHELLNLMVVTAILAGWR